MSSTSSERRSRAGCTSPSIGTAGFSKSRTTATSASQLRTAEKRSWPFPALAPWPAAPLSTNWIWA